VKILWAISPSPVSVFLSRASQHHFRNQNNSSADHIPISLIDTGIGVVCLGISKPFQEGQHKVEIILKRYTLLEKLLDSLIALSKSSAGSPLWFVCLCWAFILNPIKKIKQQTVFKVIWFSLYLIVFLYLFKAMAIFFS
jgi:hypothetical protein